MTRPAILAILLATAASAQPPSVLDPHELELFLDGMLAAQLRASRTAGAAVAVVQNGKVILTKGYGLADLANGRPVSAASTLFRIGSVSKPLMATAVMQLVAQGKLDLNADVNRYLKGFQIPATFPQLVTLHHLLTHTAGFEDVLGGLFLRQPSELKPLREILATRIPARIRPPGEFVAYSNYSSALAAYLVEAASGLPYEQYLEQNVLAPLGMTSTSARQPLPAALAARMSAGYKDGASGATPAAFEFVGLPPAGSVSTTADDMARFMIAHLDNGQFESTRILPEAAARQMHDIHFSFAPAYGGAAYGFWDRRLNGIRVVEHSGDTQLFHAILMLLPGHRTGLFAVFNSDGGAASRTQLQQAFLDRYYPKPPLPTTAPPAVDLQRFAGHYRMTRREVTRAVSIASLLESRGGTVPVTVAPDGTLRGFRATWRPVEPLVFRSADGNGVLVFREDAQGTITQAALMPYSAFEKVAWTSTPAAHFIWIGVCGFTFLTAVLFWPVTALTRPHHPRGRFRVVAAAIAWLLSLAFLLLAAGLALNLETLVAGLSPTMRLLLLSGYALLLLALTAVACAVGAWRRRVWSLPMRIHYTLVALSGLFGVLFLHVWNLLGVHY